MLQEFSKDFGHLRSMTYEVQVSRKGLIVIGKNPG